MKKNIKRRKLSKSRSKTKRSRFIRTVKSISRSTHETKKNFYNANLSFSPLSGPGLTTYNLAYRFGNGTDQYSIIGDEIFMKGVKVVFTIKNLVDFDVYYEIGIMGCNDYNVVGSVPISSVRDTNYSLNHAPILFDGTKAKCYGRKVGKLSPNFVGHDCTQTKSLYVKMNRNWRFKQKTVDYQLRGFNYYFYLRAWTDPNNGSIENMVSIWFDFVQYFKDA